MFASPYLTLPLSVKVKRAKLFFFVFEQIIGKRFWLKNFQGPEWNEWRDNGTIPVGKNESEYGNVYVLCQGSFGLLL